jgi:hypothetical protein
VSIERTLFGYYRAPLYRLPQLVFFPSRNDCDSSHLFAAAAQGSHARTIRAPNLFGLKRHEPLTKWIKKERKGIKIPKEQLDSNEIHFTSSYTYNIPYCINVGLISHSGAHSCYNNKGAQLAIIY